MMIDRIRDKTFGRLEWDKALSCWLGGIHWPPGLHTEVAIWLPANDSALGLRLARDGLGWLKANEEHARRHVAGEMLDIYNDMWRDEDEPITEAEFIGRIELVRIGFKDEGSLLLSYDARDMFGGHVLDGLFGADRSFRGCELIG